MAPRKSYFCDKTSTGQFGLAWQTSPAWAESELYLLRMICNTVLFVPKNESFVILSHPRAADLCKHLVRISFLGSCGLDGRFIISIATVLTLTSHI
jgi:hypothetical protein